jgi:hypothetical protein
MCDNFNHSHPNGQYKGKAAKKEYQMVEAVFSETRRSGKDFFRISNDEEILSVF